MPPYCEEHAMYHVTFGEHGKMRRDAMIARREALRRRHAEQIAAATVTRNYPESVEGWLGGPDNPTGRLDFALASDTITSGDILAMLTAAALQALNETENAR